ncbi:MAG TPA: hypothetical protein V6D05_05730 [Stenomitos sp.]
MAGISGIGSQAPVRPKTFTPAVEGVGVQAGGGDALRMNGDSFTSVVRMGTPLYKVGLEHANVGFLGRLFGRGGASGAMSGGVSNVVSEGLSFGGGTAGGVMSGGVGGGIGGAVGGAVSGIGGAVKQAFSVFAGALKSNFLVSAAVSGVTNLADVVMGKTSPKKAVATFAVDTAAYTGIGATSTMIGAALGSLIPIPFVGTALGVAAGIGLGFLYEKTVRNGLVQSAGKALFKQNV